MANDAPTAKFPPTSPDTPGKGNGGAQLVVIEGKNRGRTIRLTAPETTIGRLADNDLVLDSEGVSRRHGRVVRQSDSYFVEDLSSAHGILLNGARLQVSQLHPLHHGDQLRLYDHVILFHEPGSPHPAPELGTIHIDQSRVSAEAEALLKQLPGIEEAKGKQD